MAFTVDPLSSESIWNNGGHPNTTLFNTLYSVLFLSAVCGPDRIQDSSNRTLQQYQSSTKKIQFQKLKYLHT